MTIRQAAAFTLLETLITITILGILCSVLIPSFYHAKQRHDQQLAIRELLYTINLARSLALSKGTAITLCPTLNGWDCEAQWALKRMIFVDHNHNHRRDPSEPLLQEMPIIRHYQITLSSLGSKSYLIFDPSGKLYGGAGRFALCYGKTDTSQDVRLIFNRLGRTRWVLGNADCQK
ncbi:MAG: GspH/FimT family pseudopilin [Legionellales bacterium]|nr:GspH/FimT family pseudopilin [Legionellales bacterium]